MYQCLSLAKSESEKKTKYSVGFEVQSDAVSFICGAKTQVVYSTFEQLVDCFVGHLSYKNCYISVLSKQEVNLKERTKYSVEFNERKHKCRYYKKVHM